MPSRGCTVGTVSDPNQSASGGGMSMVTKGIAWGIGSSGANGSADYVCELGAGDRMATVGAVQHCSTDVE